MNNNTRSIELLAPAKNLQCGMAAIDCGADAVYIGAPKFGARAAVGNSVADIKTLTDYAHQFGAKVYVTMNTIVYDNELDEARETLQQIKAADVDAVLVQDMAVAEMAAQTGLVLHASTQTDNRNMAKAKWLHHIGFERVVLARELSLQEIAGIHHAMPDVELEAFVHGALCVSYSGACYASQYCFGRSANRGECAQFCRMKFDLIDANGDTIEHDRHLLSLKDMAQINHLKELADAGVVSFKIEGRLKDETYVRNVVAAYSRQLDKICNENPSVYRRASFGEATHAFTPNLKKTFNRGFTNYFLNGRKPDIFSPDTPKAMGEFVGTVKELRHNSFNVSSTAAFANGDGLCFINENKELEGFRVNRAEGNRLFPLQMPARLKPGMALYRNNDVAFEKELMQTGTERKIPLHLVFSATANGFALQAEADGFGVVKQTIDFDHQEAKKPQRDNIVNQLSKFGGTIYKVADVEIEGDADRYFIPSSLLSQLRQNLIAELALQKCRSCPPKVPFLGAQSAVLAGQELGFDFKNVSNLISKDIHEAWGVSDYHLAPEADASRFTLPLMQCRHCLRYSLGYCVKRGGRRPEWKEPLTLRLGDGREFTLQFDCRNCQMNVFAKEGR